jgi:hypothetical protein
MATTSDCPGPRQGLAARLPLQLYRALRPAGSSENGVRQQKRAGEDLPAQMA